MDSGASITAVLRLNTTQFTADINKARETLTSFRNSMSRMGENSAKIKGGIDTLVQGLSSLIPLVSKFSSLVTETASFNKFTNGLKNMSIAVQNLSNVTNTSQVGMIRIKEIMNAWSEAARGLTVNIRGLQTEESAEVQSQRRLQQMYLQTRNDLLQMGQAVNRWSADVIRMDEAEAQSRFYTQMLRKEWGLTGNELAQVRAKLLQLEGAVINFGKATAVTSADLKKMGMAEKELSASSTQASSSLQRQSAVARQSSSSMASATTQATRLGKAFSSLKMAGTMVASMFAYNFAHNLLMATTETVHSKSEMEGYFQMLHLGTDKVDEFNKSLEETVKLFPRLNKYSLGETISSVGVEFDLSIDEMKKAMPVVSMITSEYLRAGRNANEASLAVKDILQGEFQRLSRETGVKAEDLKEAGWSGDNKDVMGLLDALDKVGKSRNWDEFVTKANSLNDAVLILQNRFGEWSADMVNAVQPTIVGAFNSIMSFSEGLAQSIGGLWQWLNGDSWGALAVKIGAVSSALLVGVHSLTAYRTGATLLEVKQMGLTKALGGLILGLKQEELANNGVSQSIAMKILGINQETVAEVGLATAINRTYASEQMGMITSEARVALTKLQTTASGENIIAHEAQATAISLVRDAETGEILVKQGYTLATESQTVASIGFTEGLGMVVAGEMLAEGQTLSLTGALGMLTGAFLTSPIGWFALAILGLASAFYVLSGGLDDSWGKMKQFNEVMKDPHASIKPYRDEVTRLEGEVEKATEKYGENSDEVKKLNDELTDAKGALDNANSSVQHGVYWNGEYQKKLEGINSELDKITRKKLGDLGVSDEEIDKISQLSDAMNTGADKDNHALQVRSKQMSNYEEDIVEFKQKLDRAGITGDEATQQIIDFQKNYDDLINHSMTANASDDWWEWAWQSLYAGMSQKSMDFNDLLLQIRGDFLNWDFLSDEGKEKIKGISDFFGGIWDGLNSSLGDWQKGAVDFLKPLDDFSNEVNKFLDDPLGYLHIDLSGLDFFGELFGGLFDGSGGGGGGIMKKIDIGSWISNLFGLGDAVDFSWASEFVNDKIIMPLQTSWSEFMSDPISYIGETFGINNLIDGLFGVADNVDFGWALEWVNTNLISPISQTLVMFMADPVSFIGDMGFSINGLLDSIFGTDVFTSIWTWTYDSIITPIGNALWSGIQQIPLVGDIMLLLGFLSDENIGASEKGRAIANWIGNGITNAIGQIPIIGDIARMLGLIPQEEPDAHGKGKGIGDSIKDGVMNGLGNLGNQVIQEFNDILSGIGQLGEQAYNTAKGWADQLWQGVNSVLQRASPGFFHDQFQLEFGQDIPNAITEAGSTAYTVAQQYGQSIKDGISETSFNTVGFDSAVGVYQDDAQIVADSSQLMGVTTSTAFNDMTLSVNQSTSQMSGNVATTYSGMQQKQQSSLNSMKSQNLQAYNEMYLKSNQSLIQMRDSTSNVTHQMVNAWDHMKNQIIASANKLKNDSTAHFNQLSNTIGGFYRKIQNPSNWGAGHGTANVRGARNSTVGRGFARGISTRTAVKHGSGSSSLYNGRSEMTVGALKRMICPNGDCGTLFDGYSLTDKVNVEDFIASIEGEHGFGWGDWHGTHYNHIKNTSDAWSMKSPVINLVGGINTNSSFKVGDFEKGTPNISFSSFVSMAESIFSRIPYKYYYDSAWKGSWLGALQAGACNCSDGADALIAFANTCNPNWSTSKVHGQWGKDGHFWAVINGKVMDTTAWQGGYGWTSPKVRGYGSPNIRRANPSRDETQTGKTVNVNIEITGTVYGVDDLDDKIQQSVQKGLREEFNDPYTVTI